MTATITAAAETTTTTQSTKSAKRTTKPVWRTGLRAGLIAAAATTAVAAAAHAAGVSFETAPGEAIPLVGFAQLTLVFSAVGVVLARVIGRRAAQPRRTFLRTTIALTALSIVPDLGMSFGAASKCVLVLTHVVAAAIVVPALASRLAESRGCSS